MPISQVDMLDDTATVCAGPADLRRTVVTTYNTIMMCLEEIYIAFVRPNMHNMTLKMWIRLAMRMFVLAVTHTAPCYLQPYVNLDNIMFNKSFNTGLHFFHF